MRGARVRRVAAVVSVMLSLLFPGGLILAQNSAVFHTPTTIPSSPQAGKEIVFVSSITNTGTETWVSGEYSILVKIYDVDKDYLTETDKIRQFKDIGPGEELAASISFDVPAEYSGTYHYTVAMELETEVLLSHYFILKVLPFTPRPELKKWTGSVQIDYQDAEATEPTTKLNLRLVDRLPNRGYLRFTTSGQTTPAISPELNNFLIFYHSKKLDMSVGDFATGLSHLTLSRSRGIKVENRLGRVSLVGLVGSPEKTFEDDLYGVRGSTNLTDDFELAVNYVGRNREQHSVTSLEGELAITPEMTLSAEYAWSRYEGGEIESESEKGNAFQLATSLYYEKLTLDASYEKVGRDFSFVGSPNTSGDSEEYDLSLTSFTDNITGSIYYSKQDSVLSGNTDRLTTSSIGADLTAAFPKLPLLLVTYSLDKMYNSENGDLLINDALDYLTVGFSYPIGKTKLSANYLKFSYKDTSEPAIDETIASTNYGLSVPWGKRATLSANYTVSSSEDLTDTDTTHSRSITLGARYGLTLGKLTLSSQYKIALAESQKKNKATSSLGLSYSFTDKSVLRLNYNLTNYGALINPGRAISDRFSTNLSYEYSLEKKHKLQLNYSFDDQRNFTALASSAHIQDSSLRLTYNYLF